MSEAATSPFRPSGLAWIAGAIAVAAATVALEAWVGRPKDRKIEVPPATGEAGEARDLDFARIRGHVERLSGTTSRVTGYEGAARAAEYIMTELSGLGISDDNIETQEFEVAVPVTREATLVSDAPAGPVRIDLHPLWPNLARTCRTGPAGITGPLVDVGKGTDAELAGKRIRDSIVVMDWDSEEEWLAVPEFGGKAVIFRAGGPASGYASRRKFLTVPADIPRFYVAREDVEELERVLAAPGSEATVNCVMSWERATARNILARVSGEDSSADAADPDPDSTPIVFHAYYDSISVVPGLSPGAEQSCGAAVLLELGRFLAGLAQKPGRPVYLLFTGGHGQSLAGMTRFVRALRQGVDSEWKDADPDSLLVRMRRPALFVGLDISSRSERLGVFCFGHFRGQYDGILRPKFGTLGLELDEFVNGPADADAKGEAGGVAEDGAEAGRSSSFVDCINLTQGRGWWTYFPYRAPFESEIPTLAGFPGITLATINDDRRFVDTPDDSVARVQFGSLERQVCARPGDRAGIANLARALAFWKGPYTSELPENKLASIKGRAVWLHQEKNFTPDEPLSGAAVFLKAQRGDQYLVGTRGIPVALTDEDGAFEFDGLIQVTDNWQFGKCVLEAYGTATPEFIRDNSEAYEELLAVRSRAGEATAAADIEMDGSVIFAVDMARPGEYPWSVGTQGAEQGVNLVCFPCRTITLMGLTDPRGYIPLQDLRVLDATTQGSPFQFGISAMDFSSGSVEGNRITLWADPTIRVRLTLGHGFRERRLVLINNSAENPVGEGLALEELDGIPSMVLQGAGDMRRLNESRAQKLELHGVNIPRVRRTREESGEYLERARAALDELDYGTYRSASEKGWALESKAYGELLSMTNNMIKGVLFYLALLMPFSYCMERILVASGTVKKRITWMVVIFTASFAVLALIHPAFRFTLTPLIVLLAFVILALAATVSLLIVGKFDSMLRERKLALTGSHEDTVSATNIAVRAIDLGIANIRRRPQRGFLTGATIVLVTFTLVSFTAIVPSVTISKLPHPAGNPARKGLLARDRRWAPLPNPLYHSLKRTFGERGKREAGATAPSVVAARGWFFSDRSGRLSGIDLAAAPGGPGGEGAGPHLTTRALRAGAGPPPHFTVSSLLCMEHTEPAVTGIDRMLVAGRWFRDEDELGIILPAHVAKFLGCGPALRQAQDGPEGLGREVMLFGQRIPVIGIIDEKQLDAFEDLDGEPLTPVDFMQQEQMAAERSSAEEAADTLDDYVHHPSDQIAIVPLKLGRRLGATLRGVAVRMAEGVDPATEAAGYVKRSNQTILASDAQTVTLFAALDTSKLSVAGQVAIPLLLGFIMVLGTMLGSVYERHREIFVYSSVGLSPASVSALFLAESSVYAVVGACLGYLTGQVVSKILLATGALSGLSLNYSAGSTVFVAVLTMLIVLVSTLFPARQAFHAAIPGSGGEDEAPSQEFGTDSVALFLPFVATPANVFGMQAYMHEFLENLQGVTVGHLAVDNLTPYVETTAGRPVPVMSFRAWVAPFDLGVSYDTQLRLTYREERDVYQYHLQALRYSGDQQNWKRLTPRFIQLLRKQLLMWRILSAEAQREYAGRGEALFRPVGV